MSPESIERRKTESKRDYSRGGCRECKRRKIKCDETKPHCVQCTRLKKKCSYPSVGEKVLRVSKKFLEKNPSPTTQNSSKPLTIQLYRGPNDFSKRKNKVAKSEKRTSNEMSASSSSSELLSKEIVSEAKDGDSSLKTPSSISNLLNSSNEQEFAIPQSETGTIEETTPGGYDQSSIQMSTTPSSLILGDMYSHEDLNLLASDLNDIVNDIMFNGKFDTAVTDNDPLNPLLGFSKESPNSQTMPYNDVIPKHVPLDYIQVRTTDERVYLKEFYEEFAMQVLPFGAYDPYSKTYANPLRDVILKYAAKESFLLAAILAQGAQSSHRKSLLQKDQDAYGSYLSTCLQLLGPALSRNRDKNVRNDLVSNIETILLTVLLLTSSNATTTSQGWRPHLKGAKDIVLKATNSKIRSSKTLILCKVWFADFEILAGTSSSLGGTLKTDDELESVLNFSDPYELSVLKEFGIVQDNGFNIMFGYNTPCVHLFRDLLKILNKKRQEGTAFKADDAAEYVRLISGFYNEMSIKYIDSKSVVMDDASGNFADLIDIVRTDKGNIALSWMDTSQQAYSLAALITIFTQILNSPYQSPFIQNLNSRLVSCISFLDGCNRVPQQVIKYSLSMIQWPMTAAGINCIDHEERFLLKKFFTFSAELGSGSAEIALKRIQKVWARLDNGKEYESEEGENNLDIVAY